MTKMTSSRPVVATVAAPDFKRELIAILFIQKWAILLTTALIFTGSVLVAFFWPPEYVAETSVLVRARKPEKAPDTLGPVQERLFAVTREDLTSEIEILKSRSLVEDTLQQLERVELEGGARNPLMVMQKLQTHILPASNVIKIRLRDRYPERAALILNTLVDNYLNYREEVLSLAGAEKFFDEQAKLYEDGLKRIEDKMVSLTEETSVPLPEKEMESNLAIRGDLVKDLSRLNDERIEKEMQTRHLAEALENRDYQLFSYLDSPTISQLGAQLMSLLSEKNRVLSTYSPTSEKVTSLNKQIQSSSAVLKEEVTKYQENLANELEILNMKIAEAEKSIVELDKRSVNLQKQLVEMNRLSRESAVLQHSYDVFSRKKEEARLSEATMRSGVHSYVSQISRAEVPTEKAFPKKRRLIPLGLIIGLLTGCSLGFLREYLDHTVKRPGDVEGALHLPVVLSLPNLEHESGS